MLATNTFRIKAYALGTGQGSFTNTSSFMLIEAHIAPASVRSQPPIRRERTIGASVLEVVKSAVLNIAFHSAITVRHT